MFQSRNRIAVSEYANGKQQALNPPGAPPGLYVFENWITPEQEKELCSFLCERQWADHMSSKRPTQHFGYKYLRSGNLDVHKKIAGDWGLLETYKTRIETEFPGVKVGQALANLYFETSGIGPHRDKECDLVFGVSAAGDINMVWKRQGNDINGAPCEWKYEALIPARSLYIMSDDAALIWTHEIPSRKQVYYPDRNPGEQYGQLTQKVSKGSQYARVSLTFRDVLLGAVIGE